MAVATVTPLVVSQEMEPLSRIAKLALVCSFLIPAHHVVPDISKVAFPRIIIVPPALRACSSPDLARSCSRQQVQENQCHKPSVSVPGFCIVPQAPSSRHMPSPFRASCFNQAFPRNSSTNGGGLWDNHNAMRGAGDLLPLLIKVMAGYL